jgi:hypothetical protein
LVRTNPERPSSALISDFEELAAIVTLIWVLVAGVLVAWAIWMISA